jgi:DNA polymerase-1
MQRKDCDRLIVFFDKGASTRERLLPEYKKNRMETPPDLEVQVPPIKEITRLMGIPVYEKQGVEADDLIGSYAHAHACEQSPVMIVSADKDLAQILGPYTCQLLPAPTANPRLGWRILTHDKVPEKFGVPAERIAEYLALVGDNADNIPGLKGVGPKTAAKWIQEHGSLETIIAKANYLSPPRFQSLVAQNEEQLRVNLKLTTLETDHEIPADETTVVDAEKLRSKLLEFEMQRTLEDVMKIIGK